MKALIIAFVLTVIIVIGWYYTFDSVEGSTSQLIDSLSELGKNIETSQWESADTKFLEIKEDWNKIRATWTIILDHHEIDNIDLAMAKAGEYVKAQNHALSLGEIETLRKLFGIVKENEALTLTNIL